MRLKRYLSLALIFLLAVSLLSGCGASTDTSAPAAEEESVALGASGNMDFGTADYAYTTAEEAPEKEVTESRDASLPDGVKLIYTANISMQTTEFDSATGELEALVKTMGGYFESSNTYDYGSYRSAWFTVRVPAEQFEAFCNQAGALCQINSISRNAEDVSESYYDTEARLKTQQTKLERLQELLSNAATMEDIIDLETAISDTELEIENLTGTLRHYDSLIGYATISISLDEVYKLTEVEEPTFTFGEKIRSGLKASAGNFADGLEDFLISIAYHWAGILLFLVIVAILVLVFVRIRRRKRKKAEKALQVQAEKPEETQAE